MKLQVGKSYINREGVIIEIIGYTSVYKLFWDKHNFNYLEDGTYSSIIMGINHLFDLVEEYNTNSTELNIDTAAMEWYNNWKKDNKGMEILSVFPSVITSWNAAIEWYKSQINES